MCIEIKEPTFSTDIGTNPSEPEEFTYCNITLYRVYKIIAIICKIQCDDYNEINILPKE
jgi:hypothetical protein